VGGSDARVPPSYDTGIHEYYMPPPANPTEMLREAWRKAARERGQHPERRDIKRSEEELRMGAQIDKLAGVGESTRDDQPESCSIRGTADLE
jgi:hypothetical protein